MKIELTPDQIAQVRGGSKSDSVDGIVYPYRDPNPRAQGNLFLTREEHDTWKRAVQQRDANLDANDAIDPNTFYKGPLNPDTLDYLDWCYYAQTPALFSREFTLFDRKPWLGVRATGELYPSLSGDISGYYAAGSKFGPYL
jgi:hypothetical protein